MVESLKGVVVDPLGGVVVESLKGVVVDPTVVEVVLGGRGGFVMVSLSALHASGNTYITFLVSFWSSFSITSPNDTSLQ